MAETETARGKQKVVIVGGGLAGMVVARELLKYNGHNMEVVILEAADRLGGKAGAKYKADQKVYEEHGYHIFPGWYANTRHLLKELGIENNLQDVDKFHILKEGEWKGGQPPKLSTFYPMSCPQFLLQNVRSLSRLLSWSESTIAFYAMVELCSQSFDERFFLDRVTANGFFYSRFYATEELAAFHTGSILQATSTPTYLISAMTLKKATSLWFAEDIAHWRWTPHEEHKVYSILKGNLQQHFIDVFRADLEKRGVKVELQCRVKKFQMTGDRVSHVKVTRKSESQDPLPEDRDEDIPADIFILATPPETVLTLLGDEIRNFEERFSQDSSDRKRLSDVAYLQSEPMTALHIYFKGRLAGVPKEHVNLLGSRYGISFIDVSQQWQEHGGANAQRTILSVIAADCTPLKELGKKDIETHLLCDLRKYVPMPESAIDRVESSLNFDAPLFLNTVGSWHFRPETRSYLSNLYVTGDYCRTAVDLTTMESAVLSGLGTARDLLKDVGMPDAAAKVAIKELRPPSPLLLRVLKYAFFPWIVLLTLWLRVQGKLRKSR